MGTMTRVTGNKEGIGEDARGGEMIVAMGHGLCVSFCLCGETTKNKLGPKTPTARGLEEHFSIVLERFLVPIHALHVYCKN